MPSEGSFHDGNPYLITQLRDTCANGALCREAADEIERLRAARSSLWGEIVAERERAHRKHGATSMESCDPMADRRLRVLVEEVGECARVLNDREHAFVDPDEPSWADIDGRAVDDLRAELVQVAAMAVAWIAALDGEALS